MKLTSPSVDDNKFFFTDMRFETFDFSYTSFSWEGLSYTFSKYDDDAFAIIPVLSAS